MLSTQPDPKPSFRRLFRPDYDAIVIGGGHGGMTAANRLATLGHSVLLLEQHVKLGGLATWFRRPSSHHIFDVSLHGFPVGMIKSMRKYWSKAIADKIVQLKNIRFINPQFELTTTFSREDYTSKMIDVFHVERNTVDAFFDETRGMNFYDDRALTTRDLFEKFFPGRNDIVRFLMEPITYANGSTLNDPAITYGIVFSNFMSQGVFIFQGGTDLLINMMSGVLRSNGVDIRTNARVEKICVENGNVCGVIVNGQFIRAKTVISNGNLISTVRDLVGYEHFSPEFVKAASVVRLNNSSCQVYIGIRRGERLPDIGDLLFVSDRETFSSESLLAFPPSSRTYSMYYPTTRPHLEPDYTIVQSTNALASDWSNLPDSEYAAKKRELEADAVARLEKILPGVSGIIDHIESATPRTFERYAMHIDGASFGTKFEGLDVSRGLSEQVGGLFHTGSVAIIMSGWLGAVNYGIIVANDADKHLRQ